MNSNIVIKVLKKNGWFLKRTVGSHYHFKHFEISGIITVPYHGNQNLHPAILHNILKMAKLSLDDCISKNTKKFNRSKQIGVVNAIANSY
jgi:predicted RNA binding protein YcfA (HicA-like mRNA interferase family)